MALALPPIVSALPPIKGTAIEGGVEGDWMVMFLGAYVYTFLIFR